MFRLINKLKNRKGFTLIELIVVLAVLAIIMAIAVPRFMGVQEQAKEDADISTLGLIAKTAELYHAQEKIGSSFNTSGGALISSDSNLEDDFEKDLPDIKFQSSGLTTKDVGDVTLTVDSDTGVAEAEIGTLSSKE